MNYYSYDSNDLIGKYEVQERLPLSYILLFYFETRFSPASQRVLNTSLSQFFSDVRGTCCWRIPAQVLKVEWTWKPSAFVCSFHCIHCHCHCHGPCQCVLISWCWVSRQYCLTFPSQPGAADDGGILEQRYYLKQNKKIDFVKYFFFFFFNLLYIFKQNL